MSARDALPRRMRSGSGARSVRVGGSSGLDYPCPRARHYSPSMSSRVRLLLALVAVFGVVIAVRLYDPYIVDRWFYDTRDRLTWPVLAIPVGMLAAEALLAWRRSSLRRFLTAPTRSDLVDLSFAGLTISNLIVPFVIAASFGLALVAGGLADRCIGLMAGSNLRVDTGSTIANGAIYLLIYSFAAYWDHRLMHHRLLWPLHRLHHSATELTPLTLYREHPAAPAILAFTRTLPLALVAAPPGQIAACLLIYNAYQSVLHSAIDSDWGWIGRWVLVSPRAHRLHHASAEALHGYNFGVVVWWDRLFGTWHAGLDAVKVGVADGRENEGVVRQTVRDLGLLARGLRYRR